MYFTFDYLRLSILKILFDSNKANRLCFKHTFTLLRKRLIGVKKNTEIISHGNICKSRNERKTNRHKTRFSLFSKFTG